VTPLREIAFLALSLLLSGPEVSSSLCHVFSPVAM
jgi:hypothetical protein